MLNAYRMIFALLNAQEKVRFSVLMGLVLVMAMFEMAGVAAILPFMHVISDQSVVFENAYLSYVYEILGFTSSQNFLIFVGLAVFALTILSLIIKALTVYALTRFSLMRSYSIADRLLSGFLNQPYPWFVGRHSSELSNKILSETDRMVSFCLLPAVRLIANVASVVAIVGLVFLLEPAIAIGSFVLLAGAYALIYFGFRSYLQRIGEVRLSNNKKRFHAVQEAFGGIKEVKLMGLERSFRTRFSDAAFGMAKAQTTGLVLGELPRFLLEGIAFGGMLLLVLFLLIRGDGSIEEILPTLGLLAVAGSRLFPAMQQVYRQVSGIRFNISALADLLDEVEKLDAYDVTELPSRADATPLRVQKTLGLNGVSYSYAGAERQALADVSIEIGANTTVGLVGGTGAGKTTIVDIILGLIEPKEGALEVDGAPVTGDQIAAWQKSLGYIPQSIFLSDDTIAANIAFGVPEADRDMDAVRHAAKVANLDGFVTQTLPNGYDTWVGERGTRLSGGERQRIGIARALYTNPDVLIMDEATSALDNQTEAAVMEAVGTLANEKTIIMIAHRLSTVKDCDRIFFLNKGRVEAFGTYDELIERSENFRQLAQA